MKETNINKIHILVDYRPDSSNYLIPIEIVNTKRAGNCSTLCITSASEKLCITDEDITDNRVILYHNSPSGLSECFKDISTFRQQMSIYPRLEEILSSLNVRELSLSQAKTILDALIS